MGDSSKIDMSVGDIYGGNDYSGIGLSKHMIASSFGKFKDIKMPMYIDGKQYHGSKNLENSSGFEDEIEEVKIDDDNQIQKCDIARSLFTMVSANNILFSKMLFQLEGIKRVVWIGSHIDLPEYMQMSEEAFARLSMQQAELIFPTYNSFLGSMGLLLSQTNFNE